MDTSNFNDPRTFVPDLLDYIDLSRLPKGVSVPPSAVAPLQGQMKTAFDCSDFIVLEPVGDYPGMPDSLKGKRRYLSAGPDSDMPGLRTDVEMYVNYCGRRVPAIAFTAYKWGTGTWAVQDAVAKGLSAQLGRHINPRDILSSGLKDRRGRTVQQFVVPGVSIAEAMKVNWGTVQWNAARSGFLVKDVRPTDKLLKFGSHRSNFFDVRIRVPGKSRAELEEYMLPRVLFLSQHEYLVPNYFHRQRLGPGQDMQRKGYALLTGDYTPFDPCNPFMNNAEVFLHCLMFAPSGRDSKAVKDLRRQMAGQWQYNFEEMERILRRVHRKFNLSLEYEVARRLANDAKFGGCCEAVLYDLRNRLSLCIGAWQAFYWNWELHSQIKSQRITPERNATIPLPMSCEDAKRTYRRTQLGQQCLGELAAVERVAAPADAFIDAFIARYWEEFNAEVARKRVADPSYRPDRDTLPDDLGLSFDLVRKLFGGFSSVDGMKRPDGDALSASFIRRLYLVPRDERGNVKPSAPRRKAFTKAEDFEWSATDECVRIRTSLRSGSYFTTLAGALFDTSDPDEQYDTTYGVESSDGNAA
jgi:tRNA(Glu) U13 pseudouridine synthase TruD